MQISFSQQMLKSIDGHIRQARGRGIVLDVYRIAEIVRVEHIDDNVALEDIIEKIVLNAGSNLPMEFGWPEVAEDDEAGVLSSSTAQLLLPEFGRMH
jgi:hypothetical protein